MGINQKDIKLLWGRSGNKCAICKTELTQDKNTIKSSFTLGEQAHIIGEKAGAARGQSNLSMEERNSYHNLILLCPNHHATIDKNEADWPVEKLHQTKSQHELWVTETLSEPINHVKLAESTILASIVDNAVNLCCLDSWHEWTSYALSPDPRWPKELPENIYKFRRKVLVAIWPQQYSEFKKATITFSCLLDRASKIFMENSELRGDTYFPNKFYKKLEWNPKYHQDAKLYDQWRDRCYESVYEATKAANWFADAVRNDINPMFFAEKGKFFVEDGPYEDLRWHTKLLEFTNEEKANYPEKALNE